MRKKRCPLCSRLNTKRHGIRSKTIKTSQGAKRTSYQYWYCKDCQKVFRPSFNAAINFSFKVRVCDLYFDAEASYRAISRRLGISAYKLFKIIDELGANCKSTLEVAQEFKPQWSGYLFIDEKRIYIKGVEWFLLLTVDLKTQDIVHWDLVEHEDEISVTWFLLIVKELIRYPFKGIISDLLGEFYGASRWLLRGIPHQFCTYHAYRAAEYYFKYTYTGHDKFWAERFLTITRIICRCKSYETALRALRYLECHQQELKNAKLLKRMNILLLRFPYLVKRFDDSNLKPDNNIIENVIKQLNQKLKKVAGFESYETAYHSIALLIMHYRFHKFTCSRLPGCNGKSPLELAGVYTSNISWVKFSQRTNLNS